MLPGLKSALTKYTRAPLTWPMTPPRLLQPNAPGMQGQRPWVTPVLSRLEVQVTTTVLRTPLTAERAWQPHAPAHLLCACKTPAHFPSRILLCVLSQNLGTDFLCLYV